MVACRARRQMHSVIGAYKKGPEFQDIKSPYQLVEKMRAAGHKAEIKEHTAGSRPAVEVRVPSRDLYVMFVKSPACGANEPRKK
jgi:hypothetical protein